MTGATASILLAIVALTVLGLATLAFGQDGPILTAVIAAIAGLAGSARGTRLKE